MTIPAHGNWVLCKNQEQLNSYVEACLKAPYFGLDYETVGPAVGGNENLDPYTGEIVGFSLSPRKGEALYAPLGHQQPNVNLDRDAAYRAITPLVTSGRTIAHHIKFEAKWTKVKIKVDLKMGICTMTLAFLDDPNRTWRDDSRSIGLKPLVSELFHIDLPDYSTVLGMFGARNFSQVPMDGAVNYGCGDADFAIWVLEALYERVKNSQPTILNLEMQAIETLIAQELRGVLLKPEHLKIVQEYMESQVEELKIQVFESMGIKPTVNGNGEYVWPFDLNSPTRVSEHLFGVMGLPTGGLRRGKNGQVSSSKKSLENLRNLFPVVDLTLQYREAEHMKNNFAARLVDYINPITLAVHGSVNNCGAPTGRCAHSEPNFAQFPKKRD